MSAIKSALINMGNKRPYLRKLHTTQSINKTV